MKTNKVKRPIADISNDLSEGLPVTKAELIRLVQQLRQDDQNRVNEINRLRDGLVKVGLMLVGLKGYTRRHHAIFKELTNLLRPPKRLPRKGTKGVKQKSAIVNHQS